MTAAGPSERTAFLEAALWHGTLEHAQAMLAAHPEVATSCIRTAAPLRRSGLVGPLAPAPPQARGNREVLGSLCAALEAPGGVEPPHGGFAVLSEPLRLVASGSYRSPQ